MYYQPETHGSGVAVLDVNDDGRPDLYFLTFNSIEPRDDAQLQSNRLFRSTVDGGFEDITELAHLQHAGHCHGVAVDDFDNDGLCDIVVTGYAECTLYHNRGDGTFLRLPSHQFPSSDRWCTGTAFLDFDCDGDVDLYVCCYAKWSTETHPFCGDGKSGVRVYCRPTYFEPVAHLIYRNDGDGRFHEASEEVGTTRGDGRGLGAVAADLNLDGFTDLYVANDMTDNFLYLNDGAGHFRDVSLANGAALNAYGTALASMGVDAEDLDGDLLPELFCTNLTGESNSLYHNLGGGRFRDISASNRLGIDSRLDTGWGTALADFDGDTWPDVIVTNGHVDDYSKLGIEQAHQQPARIWHNDGNLQFASLGGRAGPYFSTKHVGRALAIGDLDLDGRLDLVMNQLDETPSILLNRSRNGYKSVTLELCGTASSRFATGAVIDLELDDKSSDSDRVSGISPAARIPATTEHNTGRQTRVLRRHLKGGGSYLSANSRRLVIGVGAAKVIRNLSVRWPDNTTNQWVDVPAGAMVRLRERDAGISFIEPQDEAQFRQ
jgi:hypothetical protein